MSYNPYQQAKPITSVIALEAFIEKFIVNADPMGSIPSNVVITVKMNDELRQSLNEFAFDCRPLKPNESIECSFDNFVGYTSHYGIKVNFEN